MEPDSITPHSAKCTLFLVNQYGQGLNRDGSLFSRTGNEQRPFTLAFEDVESARAFSEKLVRELPHAECNVVDQSGSVVLCHYDEAWLKAEGERVSRMFAEAKRRDLKRLGIVAGIAVLCVAGIVYWLIRK